MGVYRTAPAPHDLEVQDVVDALVRDHHAGEEQRQRPAAHLADHARRVATEVDPTVPMVLPMAGVVGLPREGAR